MSKGPGRTMRSIDVAISAEPRRHFTYEELTAIAYDGPSTHSRRVAVQRAVHALVLAGRVSLGSRYQPPIYPERARHFCTIRAFDPGARSSASIVDVEPVQVAS
jgi:hypothetical protein